MARGLRQQISQLSLKISNRRERVSFKFNFEFVSVSATSFLLLFCTDRFECAVPLLSTSLCFARVSAIVRDRQDAVFVALSLQGSVSLRVA